MRRLLLALIAVYQQITKFTPGSCRFTPTCSEYARQAITKYGAWRGTWMAIKRIGRCHPWHPGGSDPVP